ncbi:hypothetical protein [Bifidobacterium felsineum]|uniref:hypothetical protein n=1 Tax=Bifidobacterium felsineum TaxID=2045440 RepID=UPI001BDC36F9|nr:hypothetical protein [Bifidobacterium felsineum]MBT1164965.1 hypothetical protein [Bifidobacterium felsineum]
MLLVLWLVTLVLLVPWLVLVVFVGLMAGPGMHATDDDGLDGVDGSFLMDPPEPYWVWVGADPNDMPAKARPIGDYFLPPRAESKARAWLAEGNAPADAFDRLASAGVIVPVGGLDPACWDGIRLECNVLGGMLVSDDGEHRRAWDPLVFRLLHQGECPDLGAAIRMSADPEKTLEAVYRCLPWMLAGRYAHIRRAGR